MTQRPLRILVVDDSPEDREAYGRLLMKAGPGEYAVIEAETSEEALRLCEQEAVDCLLVDYTLPDIDGLELLARLRGENGSLPIPVIFLTGTGNEAVAVRAMKHGVDDYFIKGQITADGVSQAIRGAVERGALRRQVERQRQELERQGVALRESEHQLRQAMEAANAGSWKITPATREFIATDQALQLYGLAPGTRLDYRRALACVHPDDRAAVQAALQRTVETGEPFRLEHRALRPGASVRWLASHAERRSEGGQICVIGLLQDITERKRHEEKIQLLLREVNHRAKNMLTLVQAVARQTVASDPDDFLKRFGERIHSIAASQDLLVKSGWKGVELGELICSQLGHFKDLIGSRIELAGPPVALSAAAAQPIGMALHELATNASKYGALANGSGRITIAWSVAAADGIKPAFAMSWCERGGPPVNAPARRGFGTAVMREMTEMSLSAEVGLDFDALGLTWRLRCPAEEVLDES